MTSVPLSGAAPHGESKDPEVMKHLFILNTIYVFFLKFTTATHGARTRLPSTAHCEVHALTAHFRDQGIYDFDFRNCDSAAYVLAIHSRNSPCERRRSGGGTTYLESSCKLKYYTFGSVTLNFA